MTETSQHAWLRLALAPGLGAAGVQSLLERWGNVEAVCQQSESTLISAGLTPETARCIQNPDSERMAQAENWLTRPNHHLLHAGHSDYPPLLSEAPGAPPVLFVAGNPGLLGMPQLAVVGSRSATANGIETAGLFARHLGNGGFTITSGLALGIDAAAHQACIANGTPTIAVCGTGPDRVYPAVHAELAAAIVDQGALVSEFPPGTEALKSHFPRRNRIISGLSRGTLVVEAGIRSGALITARFASEQGREVFAVPGSIHSAQSKGCHRLIKQGAKLVETADDIIEDLLPAIRDELNALQNDRPDEAVIESPKNEPISAADPSYEKLLSGMGWDPVSVDVLVERCGLTAGEVSSMLLILELENQVETLAGGRYQRKAAF